MKTIIGTAAALSVTALISLGASPAHSAKIGVGDPNDSPHGSDLLAVEVDHRANKLVVVTTHDNLRPNPKTGSSGAVFIDTDPEDKGPEYVFLAGFTQGTDYQLVETEGFHANQFGDPVLSPHDLHVNYVHDQVRFVVPRTSIGEPAAVRVAVRVNGTRNDGTSNGLTDWLGQPRQLTSWVSAG